MNNTHLFTDVSLNPKSKVGVGAYFVADQSFLDMPVQYIEKTKIVKQIKTWRFEDTSSTKLEVQTVLWAVEKCREAIRGSGSKLKIYTDSQCVTGLPGRRSGLEENKFLSKRTGNPLKNAILYQQFYKLCDGFGFEVVKVAGHLPASSQDTVHRIFSYVDREARKELKIWMSELNMSNTQGR